MESKSVKTNRRKYDSEFKQEVLRMIESGRSVADIARSLGIGSNLIYLWVRSAKMKQQAQVDPASTLAFNEEKLLLQKRIKELEQERDILKKALGIFSRPVQ